MQLQGRADVAIAVIVEDSGHVRVEKVVPRAVSAPVPAAEAKGRGNRTIANVGRGGVASGMDDGAKEVRLHLRAAGHGRPDSIEDVPGIVKFTKVCQGADDNAGSRLSGIESGTRRRFTRHP